MKKILEFQVRILAQPVDNRGHALTNRERFHLDLVVAEKFGAAQDVAQGIQHVSKVHFGRDLHHLALGHKGLGNGKVAALTRQVVQVFSGLLETLVFLQSADQFSPGIILVIIVALWFWQQHS